MFLPIIVNYLKNELKFYKKTLKNPKRLERTKYTFHDLHLIFTHKKATLERLGTGKENDYHNEDWLQIINIIYQIYVFHTPSKNEISFGTLHINGKKVPNAVIKAHYQYACRKYLQTAPKGKSSDNLENLHELFQQIDLHRADLMLVHGKLL